MPNYFEEPKRKQKQNKQTNKKNTIQRKTKQITEEGGKTNHTLNGLTSGTRSSTLRTPGEPGQQILALTGGSHILHLLVAETV